MSLTYYDEAFGGCVAILNPEVKEAATILMAIKRSTPPVIIKPVVRMASVPQYLLFESILVMSVDKRGIPLFWEDIFVVVSSLSSPEDKQDPCVQAIFTETLKIKDVKDLKLYAMANTKQSMAAVYNAARKLLSAMWHKIHLPTTIVPLMWAAVGRKNPFGQ